MDYRAYVFENQGFKQIGPKNDADLQKFLIETN